MKRLPVLTLLLLLALGLPALADPCLVLLTEEEAAHGPSVLARLQENPGISLREFQFLPLTGGFRCQTDAAGQAALRQDAAVRDIIPLREGWGLAPSRPLAGRAQPPYTSWILSHLGFDRLRQRFGLHGGAVRVGLIDTGVVADHPDLAGKIEGFRDFIQGRTEAYDDHGHGSFVAGILAGGPRCGAAPELRLRVAKAIRADGVLPIQAGLDALEYLADPDGDPGTDDYPRIIVCPFNNPDNEDRSLLETMSRLRQKGILLVSPTRMDGPAGVGVPAGYPCVLSVGGTTDRDTLSWFSGYGVSPFDGRRRPTLAAPAEWVFSTLRSGGYGMKDGADFACAFVGAAAALLISARETMDAGQVETLLREHCRDLGGEGRLGAGLLQPEASLDALLAVKPVRIRIVDPEGRALPCRLRISGHTPPRVDFRLDTADVRLELATGNYQITAECFRYETLTWEMDGQETDILLRPRPRPLVPIRVGLRDATDRPLAGAVRFPGQPGLNEFSIEGDTSLLLEAGEHRVLLSAYGYEPREARLLVKPGAVAGFTLQALPALLLIDDDGPAQSIAPVADCLTKLGITFTLYRTDDLGRVTPRLLAQFQTVYWHLGPRLGQHLAGDDMAAIASFLDLGGRLLITGQDLAYHARGSRFLEECLGSAFRRDLSLVTDVFGSEDYPELAGWYAVLDTAGNDSGQLSTDVIARADGCDDARELLQWGPPGGFRPGAAAVLFARNPGRSLFLAFGLEGIPQPERRRELLRSLLVLLEDDEEFQEARCLPTALRRGADTAALAILRLRQAAQSLPDDKIGQLLPILQQQRDAIPGAYRRPVDLLLQELQSRTLMGH